MRVSVTVLQSAGLSMLFYEEAVITIPAADTCKLISYHLVLIIMNKLMNILPKLSGLSSIDLRLMQKWQLQRHDSGVQSISGHILPELA
jgi:hypothetical protein